MSTIAAFLMALVGPVAKRVLLSLGFGLVSYAAIATAVNSLLGSAKSAWGGMTGDVLSLVQLSGANTAVSIIAGAIVAKVALMAVTKLQLLS